MKHTPQSGSAILWVLIAVSLFAAVGFAMSYNSRTSTSIISGEQARVYAQQIIAYGNDIKNAVKRLELRGCTPEQISFDNAAVIAYVNNNAPDDKSCHVFDIKGGGLQFATPPSPFAVTDATWFAGRYSFSGSNTWKGNGTDCAAGSCAELTFMLGLPTAGQEVCDKINELLGYSARPTESHNTGGTAYTGAFTYQYALADESASQIAEGKQAACFGRVNATNPYVYTLVLLSR